MSNATAIRAESPERSDDDRARLWGYRDAAHLERTEARQVDLGERCPRCGCNALAHGDWTHKRIKAAGVELFECYQCRATWFDVSREAWDAERAANYRDHEPVSWRAKGAA